MVEQAFAPAAERNAAAITELLSFEFRDCRNILEIGSGTGQHAVYVGAALPHLQWQTSDLDDNRPAINAWIQSAGLPNVRPPLLLDVRIASVADEYDAVFSANTAHIMSVAAVADMFAVTAGALRADGVFCLYGPFLLNGQFTTVTNEQFDRSLRASDPNMGIRDLADLDRQAEQHGLHRVALYSMPANNFTAIWRKTA